MSKFPEWIEEWFGLWSEPSYKQAQEIHRAFRQAGKGEMIDESREFTPEDWNYLVERIRAQKGRATD